MTEKQKDRTYRDACNALAERTAELRELFGLTHIEAHRRAVKESWDRREIIASDRYSEFDHHRSKCTRCAGPRDQWCEVGHELFGAEN